MSAWVWVPIATIYVIHDRQISRHGGAAGLRDASLLEAGCARPMNLAAYERPDAFDIAAAYAFGIAKAHAFVDGNKRTGLVAALTFLRLNGFGLRPDPIEGVRMMEQLAASEVDEAEFANWMRAGAQALSR